MLTMAAYEFLSVIECGEVTVHTLYLSVYRAPAEKRLATQITLNSLIELVSRKLVVWEYYSHYGDRPPVPLKSYSVKSLLDTWKLIFGYDPPKTRDPSPSTITFEISEKGRNEVDREIYDIYSEYMDRWYS
jgi:hypothetical protein